MTPEEYEAFKEERGGETGMAWGIRGDDDEAEPVAFLEPINRVEDPENNILSYVNTGNNMYSNNLRAFQLRGRIYYIVTRPIGPGAELFVPYGPSYEQEELGLDPVQYSQYPGRIHRRTF